MATTRERVLARVSALLGPGVADARQSLVALLLGLLASTIAGLTLASITDTLEELAGLLVLVPGAISLRGTIFGALGSRLGTSIHAGTFVLRARRDTVLGQNVLAAAVLSLVTSVVLAFLAKAAAVAFGIVDTISIPEMMFISVVGGLLASAVMLVITVALARGAVRYEWDPDNVMAPLITAAGDLFTLPALYLASLLVDVDPLVGAVFVLGLGGAVVAVVAALRSGLDILRRVLRESLVVITAAGAISLVAGLMLEGRLDQLSAYPALLALVPPFLASAGSLGGILSNRLTSKLHLGVIEPTTTPSGPARGDIVRVFALAVPTFVVASLIADAVAAVADLASPGALDLLVVAVVGGLLATFCATVVAYYSAIVSFRNGVDPDTVGIPLVTSSIDLAGTLSFVIVVAVVGVA